MDKNITDQDLETNFTALVKTERKITSDVLLYIQEIDKRKLHLSLGYASLAEYLIKKHHYSEGSAFRRISAARILTAVPEIKDKIVDGSLNLSQLSMAQMAVAKKQREDKVVISNEDKRDLLLQIEGQSIAKTQGLLADNLNVELNEKKQITYGKEEGVYLNLKLTKEEFEKAKECLDFMSHQAHNYKELVMVLIGKVLKSKKTEPCKTQGNFATKSNSVENNQSKVEENEHSIEENKCNEGHQNKVNSKIRSRFIPAALKKEIFKRDQWSCQYKGSNGHVCRSKRHLQIHHIKAFAKGGANTIENLSLRCHAHNLYEAEQEGLAI